MQRFITQDGIYEVDPERRRIRMRSREHAGKWRTYAAISPVRVGSPVHITWEPEDISRAGEPNVGRTRAVSAVL